MSIRRGIGEIYREAIGFLLISLAGGIFAGTVLGGEEMLEAFATLPGLLLLVPAFLATRGSVYGSLGARLSSGLHQGLIEPNYQLDPRLTNAVIASFINGIGISLFIGVLSWAVTLLVRPDADPSLLGLVGIMLIAGVLTSIVLIVGLIILVFGAFSRGYDPDNLIGPIVTTLGDIFGVVFLLIAVIVVQGVL